MDTAMLVHLVEDDENVRCSLAFLLRSAGYKSEMYPDGQEFLQRIGTDSEGVVLLDIRLGEQDGLSVHEEMIRRNINLPVVITTGHGDVSTAVRAMKNGARDFLEKPYDDEVLFTILERLAAERAGQAGQTGAQARQLLTRLSPREHQVLDGLLDGYQNKTIAYNLGLSTRTVEMHRTHLMKKLGTRTLSSTLSIGIAARDAV